MNIRRFKLVLALCMIVLSAFACGQAFAALQAQVDRNPVAANETFNLILQTAESTSGDPDLSALKNDFDVLGQNKSSSLQIVNGQASRSTRWQVSLMAKHTGEVQIPAISVDGQTSAPISLKVLEANQAQTSQESSDLFVEISAEPQTVYVQQQVIVTARLYSTVNLSNGSLSDPGFPNMDAATERLGNDRSFQTERRGKAYNVTERRYALFPQKSGQFAGDPVVFDGSVIDQNQNGGFFSFGPFAQASHRTRVRSNVITLTVKPIPANYSGDQWLPVNKLQLSEKWSADPTTLTVGEPITRTLEESASGATAAQLPALTTATTMDGFKLYPDQAQLTDDKNDSGISGKRVQKIAYIPTRSGSVTLPAIEMKWWDATAGKEQVANLPARTFTVLPGKPSSTAAETPPGGSSPDAATLTASANADSAPAALAPGSAKTSAGWWPWLSLMLGCGWCATLFLWWRSRQKNEKPKSVDAHIESLNGSIKQLKKACAENDRSAAKNWLLGWARLQWPQESPVSLTAIAHRCNPGLADALTELDRALYSSSESAWQGAKLWALFSDHNRSQSKKKPGQTEVLNPLYPL